MHWLIVSFCCLLSAWTLPMLDAFEENTAMQIAIAVLRGCGLFTLGIGFGMICA